MSETLQIFGKEYSGVTAIKAEDPNGNVLPFYRPSGSVVINQNGSHDVSGKATAVVAVPTAGEVSLQSKSATPTESAQTITADSGYDGLSSVEVGAISSSYVGSGIDRRDDTDLSASGATVTVPAGYYDAQQTKSVVSASQAIPSVSIDSTTGLVTATATQTAGYVAAGTESGTLQLSTQAAATIAPTEASQVAVAAGKYTLGAVTVDAISSSYVGSGITRRSASDLYGEYDYGEYSVNVPAGYYETSYYKAVPNGSATTPSTSITANPTISVDANGLITVSVSASQNVTPTVSAGYVSSGTAGQVSVSGSNTQQLTTQAAQTVTPTKSQQTVGAAGRYMLGAVTVEAIPAAYQDVSNVDATAGDVVSGKIFVNSSGTEVEGTLVIQHYYTGSTDPSSSLGENGDIYLKVVS